MEAAQATLTAAEAELAALQADLQRSKTRSAERLKLAAQLTRCAACWSHGRRGPLLACPNQPSSANANLCRSSQPKDCDRAVLAS